MFFVCIVRQTRQGERGALSTALFCDSEQSISRGRNKRILRIYFIQFIMVRCELLIT